ncbi:hypothetical protein IF2G_08636 [Cordyceps javanica]|nr:hypothetical protein IF2G_08636 [Cordyceps javanica]
MVVPPSLYGWFGARAICFAGWSADGQSWCATLDYPNTLGVSLNLRLPLSASPWGEKEGLGSSPPGVNPKRGPLPFPCFLSHNASTQVLLSPTPTDWLLTHSSYICFPSAPVQSSSLSSPSCLGSPVLSPGSFMGVSPISTKTVLLLLLVKAEPVSKLR